MSDFRITGVDQIYLTLDHTKAPIKNIIFNLFFYDPLYGQCLCLVIDLKYFHVKE